MSDQPTLEALDGLPLTSLIICSRNRPLLLSETIESVLVGNEMPTEIVIVDQSDDPHPTLPLLTSRRGCAIRYHWRRSRGLSRASNEGIEITAYDILAWIHDDALVSPDWFGALVRALIEAGPDTIVTGRVLPADTGIEDGFQMMIKKDTRPACYQGRVDQDVLFPLNMNMCRSTPRSVGTFDE